MFKKKTAAQFEYVGSSCLFGTLLTAFVGRRKTHLSGPCLVEYVVHFAMVPIRCNKHLLFPGQGPIWLENLNSDSLCTHQRVKDPEIKNSPSTNAVTLACKRTA